MGRIFKKAAALLLVLCLCLLSLGAAEDVENGEENAVESGAEAGGEDTVESGGESNENQLYLHKALAALSQDPVALMEVANIKITTSANHCAISGFTWYAADGSVYGADSFGMDIVRVEITVAAADGYLFAEDVAGYINNSSDCDLTRDPTGTTVTLSKNYVPALWAPSIIYHPKAATVDEGEYASFWVSGLYVAEYDWYLKGPDGQKVPVDKIKDYFSGASASENGTSSITIKKIPAEMDGWSIVCTFIAAGRATKVDSNAAKITVKRVEPTPAPTSEPTPTPAPEPTAEPAETTENSEVSPEATEEHVHDFSTVWNYDGDKHWHSCDCGERREEQAHLFGRTDQEERNVCTICGYTEEPEATPEPEKTDGENTMEGLNLLRWLLAVVAAGLAIGIVVLLAQAVRDSRRSKHSRRRRRF